MWVGYLLVAGGNKKRADNYDKTLALTSPGTGEISERVMRGAATIRHSEREGESERERGRYQKRDVCL